MPDRRSLDLWRALVPRWSYLPLSGDGAARFGGRWNPVGTPTIYSACELSTAWAEYNQGFVQHPALIVRLELRDALLADLTDSAELAALGIPQTIHATQWRDELDHGLEPETHRQQARLVRAGYDGITYPSFMSPGGTCVALWRWNAPNRPSLAVVDPDRRLLGTPASWT